MFEVFEHTADLGLRVRAATEEALFQDAARGLFSLIVSNLADVQLTETHSLRIEGTEREYLLFDWLNELLYWFESRRLVLADFQVQLTPDGLTAVCRGEPLAEDRHRLEHEVKAITYHGLKMERTGENWQAELIVDI
jgi:SHS2 domain-containing protein